MYSRHKSGAIAELKAAQFFLENDYEIFFPTTASTADFIAMKGSELIRVQVKSAYYMERPGSSYVQVTTRRNSGEYVGKLYTKEDYDLLVVVYEDKLWIFPVEDVCHLQSIILEKGQQVRRAGVKNFNPDPYRVKPMYGQTCEPCKVVVDSTP